MPTTIRDLLDEPSLGLELLVEGDIDRELRWVHVTELIDASPYLVGEELVLTAGVWRGRRHSAEDFVRALLSRDVAGIGYGLLEGDMHAPPAVVKACRSAGIPLVLVPLRTPFVAVSQHFVERLTADREAGLRLALRLNADLLAAAEAPVAADALAAVAQLLRRSTGHRVWIADDAGVELARAGRAPDDDTRAALLRHEPCGWTAHDVDARRGHGAVIAVEAGPDALEVRSRVDTARPVVGLILARERAVRETERRLAGEVVSLVLGRQLDAAAARMPYYGLDPHAPLVALVCVVADRERALAQAERWIDGDPRAGVVALRGDELMLVVDSHLVADAADLHDLATRLGSATHADAVGTGPVAHDVSALRRGLVQARQAAELGRRRGGGIVVSHDRTGDHALLLALQDQDVLDAFRESLLAPLDDYDRRHRTDLVATLRTFLETGGRWQETATLLHVHVNTLRHRIERIEALSSRRLDSTPDRVDLWLALQSASAGTHRP